MKSNHKAVTLIELLIAISLIAVVVLGFSNINLFSRYQVITSDRRSKVQNEAAYVMEHITKQAAKAIGNEKINGSQTVVQISNQNSNAALMFYVDGNSNGQRDTTPNSDYWACYYFYKQGGNANTIKYCSQCRDSTCINGGNGQCVSDWEVLSTKITSFTPSANLNADNTLAQNYVNVALSACWGAPNNIANCGTGDNPNVTMQSNIVMPSVSVN